MAEKENSFWANKHHLLTRIKLFLELSSFSVIIITMFVYFASIDKQVSLNHQYQIAEHDRLLMVYNRQNNVISNQEEMKLDLNLIKFIHREILSGKKDYKKFYNSIVPGTKQRFDSLLSKNYTDSILRVKLNNIILYKEYVNHGSR